MSINARFNQIITTLFNGKKSAFASAISVAPSVVDNIVGKRQGKPSFEVVEKISAIAELNMEWLITGKGNMLKSEADTDISTEEAVSIPQAREVEKNIPKSEMRPRIPLEAAAGTLSLLTQSVTETDCEYFPVVPLLPSYDFTIGVKGDSMEPEFKAGDEVACRMVRQNAYIQWGRPYVIDSYDGIVLKRVQDDGDCVICTSDNPRYGAFKIPKSEIYHMALVIGLIRQY